MFLLKALLVFSLYSGLSAEVELDDRITKDDNLLQTVRSLIECIKPKLISGVPEVGLPPLDPLKIDDISLNLDTGYISLHNAVVKGITGFDVTYITLTSKCGLLCYELNSRFLVPILSLYTDYDADVTFFETLNVYGTGNLSLSLTDIVPSVYVQVALSSGVKNFTANVEVDDVEFHITGLLNNDYMSVLITNLIKSIIRDHMNEIIQTALDLFGELSENGEEGNFEQIITIAMTLARDCLKT